MYHNNFFCYILKSTYLYTQEGIWSKAVGLKSPYLGVSGIVDGL